MKKLFFVAVLPMILSIAGCKSNKNYFKKWNDCDALINISVFIGDGIERRELLFHGLWVGFGRDKHKIVVLAQIYAVHLILPEQSVPREKGYL